MQGPNPLKRKSSVGIVKERVPPWRVKERQSRGVREYDMSQGHIEALADSIRSALVAPKDDAPSVEMWYEAPFSGAVASTVFKDGRIKQVAIDRANGTPGDIAHELGHETGKSNGHWYSYLRDHQREDEIKNSYTPEEIARADYIQRIQRAASREIPDTSRNEYGLPFNRVGGDEEKFPYLVNRSIRSLRRASDAGWQDLDAQRDLVAREHPLVMNMIDALTRSPEYKNQRWLTKPKLPKSGLKDQVRR